MVSELRSPRYWAAELLNNSLVEDRTKARPSVIKSSYSLIMANTNVVEKDGTEEVFDEMIGLFEKSRGKVWKA